MAKKSIAQLEAALAAKTAEVDGLVLVIRELKSRIKHDYIERSEYNRVQRLLKSTQAFCNKYKTEARGAQRGRVEDRREDGLTEAQRIIRAHQASLN